MSIVERLFPASELDALRASPYDFDVEPNSKRRELSSTPSIIFPECHRTSTSSPYDFDVEPNSKRRKLSSTASVVVPECHRTSTSDSGYSSDEECPVPESWLAPRKRSRSSLSNASSAGSRTQSPSSYTQSALFRKYLSTKHPMDSAKYRLHTQSNFCHLTPDDLKDFYHQITLARSRSRSSNSGLPTPPYSNGGTAHNSPSMLEDHEAADEAESCVPDVGQGWTAGPKSAMAANLSARIFDGVRITSHERSMLNSLIPGSLPASTTPRNSPPMSTLPHPQRRETQIDAPAPARSSFAGIAISAYSDDEDEIANDGIEVHGPEGECTGKVEDFFNIEEASYDIPPPVMYGGFPTSYNFAMY